MKNSKIGRTLLFATLGLSAAAIAATGVVTGDGIGKDRVSACKSAKDSAQRKLYSLRFTAYNPGIESEPIMTSFRECDCSENPIMIGGRKFKSDWTCFVDGYWKTEKLKK